MIKFNAYLYNPGKYTSFRILNLIIFKATFLYYIIWCKIRRSESGYFTRLPFHLLHHELLSYPFPPVLAISWCIQVVSVIFFLLASKVINYCRWNCYRQQQWLSIFINIWYIQCSTEECFSNFSKTKWTYIKWHPPWPRVIILKNRFF